MISQDIINFIFECEKQNVQYNHANLQPQHHNTNKTVDYIKHISYETFFKDYLCINKPCVILVKDIEMWRSRKDWVADKRPDFDMLKREFGLSLVPVADCNVREYNSQKKQNMVFGDYIEYWRNLEREKISDLLYLKDWHFKREFPDYKAYETPEYFKSDWLNEFCKNQDDDYQFVYMGPKGTWTPLHSDVFGSYSWSVNICGRKKWILFPPGQENFLKDETKQVKYMVDEQYLDKHGISYFNVIQEAGEIIFVPSGWYHQVWNLEDTISINHNWFNGCNIYHIWKCLHQAAVDVENEIADIKEFEGWEDQLQIILKAHHGMNYADFLLILQFIVKSRIEEIKLQNTNINWHFVYDLLAIKNLSYKIRDYKTSDIFSDCINNLCLEIKNFFYKSENIRHLYVE